MKFSKWLIPQLLIFLVLGFKLKLALAFFWIIIHEFIHYLIAVRLGADIKNLKLHFIGAAIEISDYEEFTLDEQIKICLAGPLFNLMCSILFFLLYKFMGGTFFYSCFEINLTLGIFNLLPCYPLDGARILKYFLAKNKIYKKASNITSLVSYTLAFMFILTFFIVWIEIHKLNITIFIMGIFSLYMTSIEKGKVMYVIMGDIIKKREKLIRNKYIDNRLISIHYKDDLIDILGLTDKNKFNIFYVLDDNLKLMYILREDELLEGLKIYGNISLEEYYYTKNNKKINDGY
ncbi:site-2 protease family protein [Clostridium tarantellae]|uniref:Peptidase M50 n=1 Tax=Clostridium tarantellae TaxID=39493 RepID=A0A6I1MK12_9CLOT|nr:site-2 protease family protein [Clostridium tarantellae]MPQ42487.1 peptidase M50 [Clostridium tarantellae]